MEAVTIKEIEKIFAVIEPLGISREAVIIPLRTSHPGSVRKLPNGKYEIIIDSNTEFEVWLEWLKAKLAELKAQG